MNKIRPASKNKKCWRTHLQKSLAVALAVAVGVTFVPLWGSEVSAAEDTDAVVTSDMGGFAWNESAGADQRASAKDPENTIVEDVDDFVLDTIDGDDLDLEDWDLSSEPEPPAMPAAKGTCAGTADTLDAMDTFSAAAKSSDLVDVSVIDQVLGITTSYEESSPIQISIDTKTGIATIKAANASDTITNVYVDNAQVREASGLGTQKVTYDTTNYLVNLHKVKVTLNGRSVTYPDPVPTLIYAKPIHKKKMYVLYHNYFEYTTADNTYSKDPSCIMVLAYWPKGKPNDVIVNGPLEANTSYSAKGLKPNKTYAFLSYFAKTVTYEGQQVTIIGPLNGYGSTLYMKTGLKKLPIKSVKVKAVNVKRHTHIIPGYVVNNAGKETWYTYRLKVTVKMKKKPGIKALYINGKKVKGNKKTYSVKFAKQNSIYTGKWVVKPYRKYYKHTIAKIPRGTKYIVKLYSYRDKTYKGYSPIQTRKAKVR